MAQKEVLLSQGKIKKSRKLGETNNGEVPFELPIGWEWVLIDQLGHDLGQEKPNSTFSYIDVGCIDKANGVIKEPGVLNAEDAPSRARKLVKRGCILYSTVRPYLLNIAVVEEDIFPKPIASTAFAVIQPFDGINSSYIYRYLRSPTFVSYVESVQTGVAYPAINDKQFYSGLFPLPPQEEQDRIVAKVDELMALCDQLESQTEARLLETLTNAKDADELNESWLRISEHFDVLFTTEDSIDQLKQIILQLAVMGKLVKQDPNDEPASKLLERIAAEKELLIKNKKIKRRKEVSKKGGSRYLFKLPDSWEKAKFTDISFLITDGAHHTPTYVESGVPFLSVKDMSAGILDFSNTRYISEEQHKELIKRCKPEKGDLLLTKVGTTGIPIIINCDREFSIFVSVALIKFPNDKINGDFLSLLVKSPLVKKQSDEGTKGVGNKNLVLRKISDFELVIPPLKEQARIAARIKELFNFCEKLRASIQTAEKTKKSLTDALVTVH